ncbi:hypothetical protein GCM10009716_37200 [Streptomyces sodiiphilus]|uniref:Uncharacterized protein n=1 Tax=Streptomyces sodiiphilus TaxID=226217 RepID=A0ABP5B0S7_9ACTN
MPDDLGGQPFPDGDGPDSRDHQTADEAFASLVLDERFVDAAEIHEPTAAERILYAALERAETDAPAEEHGFHRQPDLDPGGFEEPSGRGSHTEDDEDASGHPDRTPHPGDEDTGFRSPSGYAPSPRPGVPPAWRPVRWQRPVACMLAVVMGISVIAFALIAIQRAGSAQRTAPAPPPAVGPQPFVPGAQPFAGGT